MAKVRISDLKSEGKQHKLAEEAIGNLANNPASYGLEGIAVAVDQVTSGDERSATIDAECYAAEQAVVDALMKVHDERGIHWNDGKGGTTDPLNNYVAITRAQVKCT